MEWHPVGEGFLRGFINYGDIDEFHIHTISPDHFADVDL